MSYKGFNNKLLYYKMLGYKLSVPHWESTRDTWQGNRSSIVHTSYKEGGWHNTKGLASENWTLPSPHMAHTCTGY